MREQLTSPVSFIKELGFNNTYGLGAPREEVFFVNQFGDWSYTATEEALLEYQNRCSRNIQTVALYMLNGRNNNTHEWTHLGQPAELGKPLGSKGK